MQVELLNRQGSKTRIELATAIHDDIEFSHNTRRRHSSLNMLTPTEFEELHLHPLRRRLTPEPRLHDLGGRSVASVAEQSSATTQQVSASTEETSATTMQISATAQHLAGTATQLEQLVGRFTLAA
jgi:hypothetical protein